MGKIMDVKLRLLDKKHHHAIKQKLNEANKDC